MFIGVRVTSGVRYILAGFVNFGARIQDSVIKSDGNLTTLNFDQTYYNPLYDGHAAAAGFMNGDIIVGLDRCDFVDAEVDPTSTPGTVTVHPTDPSKVLHRRLVPINDTVTQEEWRDITASCELLLPSEENVTMAVRRRV